MKKKSMREFIHWNRAEIDKEIKRNRPDLNKLELNDQQREQWILSDDNLYDWARREGVNI